MQHLKNMIGAVSTLCRSYFFFELEVGGSYIVGNLHMLLGIVNAKL